MSLRVGTQQKRQIIDITDNIESGLEGEGVANVFVKHTTAAITTADLDPGTDVDYLKAFEKMTPETKWSHPHDPGHFPDHLWASVIGPDVSIPYSKGKLLLGTWQRVVLIEFDGPRDREISLAVN